MQKELVELAITELPKLNTRLQINAVGQIAIALEATYSQDKFSLRERLVELLGIIAQAPREDSIPQLRSLSSLIFSCGGSEPLLALNRGICAVWRWWP
jgi:hypothetical protein